MGTKWCCGSTQPVPSCLAYAPEIKVRSTLRVQAERRKQVIEQSFVQSPTFLLCLSMSWLCSWRARRVGNHRGFQEHPPDAFSCKASLSWCTTHNPRPQKCNTGLHEDEFSWSPTNAVPGREKEETWFRYRKEWIALRKSNLVLEHEVLFIFSGLIPTRCSQTVFKN